MRASCDWLLALLMLCVWQSCCFSDFLSGQEDPLPPNALVRMGSMRLTHATWLTGLQFSPDDSFIAAADHDGNIRFWDSVTGSLLGSMPEKTGSELAFSPDGRLLAVGGYYYRQTRLWDFQKSEWVGELPCNARDLVFTPDGMGLVTAGEDPVVRLWDVESLELIREFKGHQTALFAVAISPDGRMLASGGGGDGTAAHANEVRLWDFQTGDELARFQEKDGPNSQERGWVYSVDFSADSKTLAIASPYVVEIWDIENRRQLRRFQDAANDAAWSPTGSRIAMPGREFGVYDPATGQLECSLAGDVNTYGTTAWSHDGQRIVSGNHSGQVQVWDAGSGKLLTPRQGHDGGISAVAFSTEGSLAASLCREDRTIRVWGVNTGKQLVSLNYVPQGSDAWWNREGSDLCFVPYSGEVATCASDTSIHYWDVATGKRRIQKLGDQRSVSFALSADATIAAFGAHDPDRDGISLYELDGGKLIGLLRPFDEPSGFSPWISSLALSGDGRRLAVGLARDLQGDGESATVQIWNVAEKKIEFSLRPDKSPPGRVCFSPDGSLLATGASGNSQLQVWRVADGTELWSLDSQRDPHGYDPAQISFSHDGKLLAAVSPDFGVDVWEMVTGRKIATYQGHIKPVTSVAFSPDSSMLLSGSEDGTMLLWRLRGSEQPVGNQKPEQLDALWMALADPDATIAARAIDVLLETPDQTVPLIDKNLTAEPLNPVEELPALIDQLQSADVAVSLKSAVRLEQFGIQASPALFRALANEADSGNRSRIERVLETIGKFPIPVDTLRRSRAIQLLDAIGGDNSLRILSDFVAGNPGSPTAEDARAAIKRIERKKYLSGASKK